LRKLNILKMFPFPEPTVIIKVKGKRIKKFFENGFKNLPRAAGSFL